MQILADYAGEMFYQGSLSKLDREYDRLCELLTEGRMDELSKECQELSQTIFQHYLNKNIKRTDIAFTLENYKKQFDTMLPSPLPGFRSLQVRPMPSENQFLQVLSSTMLLSMSLLRLI